VGWEIGGVERCRVMRGGFEDGVRIVGCGERVEGGEIGWDEGGGIGMLWVVVGGVWGIAW